MLKRGTKQMSARVVEGEKRCGSQTGTLYNIQGPFQLMKKYYAAQMECGWAMENVKGKRLWL